MRAPATASLSWAWSMWTTRRASTVSKKIPQAWAYSRIVTRVGETR